MLISYAVRSRNSGGKTGLKMEQPIYRVGDGLRALPPGGHATIRSFVFGVGVEILRQRHLVQKEFVGRQLLGPIRVWVDKFLQLEA